MKKFYKPLFKKIENIVIPDENKIDVVTVSYINWDEILKEKI